MASPDENLGQLLVRQGHVTHAQLNHALHVQKSQIARQRLGDILLDNEYISREKLRKVVDESGKRELLGELLVHQGVINRSQLEEALAEQREKGGRFGRILIEKDLIDEEKLARALSRQLDVIYMVPQSHLVDMNIFNRLSEAFVRDNCTVPVSDSGGVVVVLVADPANETLKRRVAEKLRSNIQLAVGIESSIKTLIDTLYLQNRVKGLAFSETSPAEQTAGKMGRLVIHSSDMTRGSSDAAANVFDYLVWDALRQRASDIHIEPTHDHLDVRYRIDGVLSRQSEFPFSLALPLLKRAEVLAHMDTDSPLARREGLIRAEVDGERVDLRVAEFRSVLGWTMVVRLFPETTGLRNLEELGMPPKMLADFRKAIDRSGGLFLFVGPKSSGKTTSLYATLKYFNDGTRKIVTIESPVAFALDGIIQNNVRLDQESEVSGAISSLLQHDPDVIAVGEISNAADAEAVLRCAIMGHRVFATMHADDSAAALLRFEQIENLSVLLRSCPIVILAQRLVRKVCEKCGRYSMPPTDIMREFRLMDADADVVHYRHGQGCVACRATGFFDRTGIFECLNVGPELREALLRKPTARELRKLAQKNSSFLSLKQTGFLKACQGITTLEEVRNVLPAFEAGDTDEQPISLEELHRRAGSEPGK